MFIWCPRQCIKNQKNNSSRSLPAHPRNVRHKQDQEMLFIHKLGRPCATVLKCSLSKQNWGCTQLFQYIYIYISPKSTQQLNILIQSTQVILFFALDTFSWKWHVPFSTQVIDLPSQYLLRISLWTFLIQLPWDITEELQNSQCMGSSTHLHITTPSFPIRNLLIPQSHHRDQ